MREKKPNLVRFLIIRVVILAALAAAAILVSHALSGCTTHRRPVWEAVAIGDVAKMPENTLVTVMNPDGVKHGMHEYGYREQCLALAGDPLTAVAFDGERVLVRHGKPVEWFYGVCVPGVLTFVWKWEFFHMNDRYAELTAKAVAERELVRRLIRDAPPEQPPQDGQ